MKFLDPGTMAPCSSNLEVVSSVLKGGGRGAGAAAAALGGGRWGALPKGKLKGVFEEVQGNL